MITMLPDDESGVLSQSAIDSALLTIVICMPAADAVACYKSSGLADGAVHREIPFVLEEAANRGGA